MSQFLSKTIMYGSRRILRHSLSPPPTRIPGSLQNPNDVFQLRWLSSGRKNEPSFTVSYLIDSLGFSREEALSASRFVNFNTPDKPDKAIQLLEKHGFDRYEIDELFKNNPGLLISDVEKTILPTMKFFEGKGISLHEFDDMLSNCPTLLRTSLESQIIPSYHFIISLFEDDEKSLEAKSVFKYYPHILTHVEKYVAPNVKTLRRHGVPDSKIGKLLWKKPDNFITSPDDFEKIVAKVEDQIFFDAEEGNFVHAVYLFRSMSKSTWESKVDLYNKFGWSEEDVLHAFRRYPRCMDLSEGKIKVMMDFFINKVGFSSSVILKHPILFEWSMDKKVIARFYVNQVLLAKSLVEEEFSPLNFFRTSEEEFLQKFVTPFKEEAPELLNLYEEKLNLSNGPLVDKMADGEVHALLETEGEQTGDSEEFQAEDETNSRPAKASAQEAL